jgi:hypothetical protein
MATSEFHPQEYFKNMKFSSGTPPSSNGYFDWWISGGKTAGR